MTKILLYNPKTEEVISTVAKPDSKKMSSYYMKGFIVIGKVWGFNVGVSKLHSSEESKYRTVIKNLEDNSIR